MFIWEIVIIMPLYALNSLLVSLPVHLYDILMVLSISTSFDKLHGKLLDVSDTGGIPMLLLVLEIPTGIEAGSAVQCTPWRSHQPSLSITDTDRVGETCLVNRNFIFLGGSFSWVTRSNRARMRCWSPSFTS